MMDTETGFDKIHAARLTALADHLERAETLKVGTFNFTMVRNSCGTAGCAVGESALLWPEFVREPRFGPTFWDARPFFGLTEAECDHLFRPDDQIPERFGGKYLGDNATRYEVAAGIRAFLAIKARQTDPPPTCLHCNDAGAVVGLGPEGLEDCRECRL